MIPFKWENVTLTHRNAGQREELLLLVCLLLYDPTLQHIQQNKKKWDFLALLYCKSPTKCQSCTRVNYQAEEHKSPFKGNIKWEAGRHSHQQEAGSEAMIIFPEIFQCSLYICDALIMMVWLFPSFTLKKTKKTKKQTHLHTKLRTDRDNVWRFKDDPHCDLILTENCCEVTEAAVHFLQKGCVLSWKRPNPLLLPLQHPLKCHFLVLWKLSHRYTFYTHSNTACSKLSGDSFPHTHSHRIFNGLLHVPLRKQKVLLNDTWDIKNPLRQT